MTGYAIFLVAPIVGGILIAVAVLLVSGLRERRERRLEARRLDGAPRSARPAPDVQDRRIAS
jgi:hypothetical protein